MNKIGIQLVIGFVLLCLIVPQFVTATTYDQQTTIVNAPSEHSGAYDEVVNVANNTAGSNYGTWDPMPSGIWVGGSTEESKFKFNTVMPAGSYSLLTWEASFTSSQIMSGASEVVVRLPLSYDTTIERLNLAIYRLESSGSYSVTDSGSIPLINFTDASIWLGTTNWYNSTNGAFTDGDAFWMTDDRCYVTMEVPIIPGELYLFSCRVQYDTDGRIKTYLSPNDVASDRILASNVTTYIPSILGNYLDTQELPLDLGASYDFRVGLGNGMTAQSYYLYAGDTIQFVTYAILNGTNWYHTLVIPFMTDNHTAKFSFSATTKGTDAESWSVSDQIYYNYIAASSGAAINVANDTDDNFIQMIITSEWDQLVTFVFYDQYKYDGTDEGDISGTNYLSNQTANILVSRGSPSMETDLQFLTLLNYYQVSSAASIQPTDVDVNSPWVYEELEFDISIDWSNLFVQWINYNVGGTFYQIVFDVVFGVSVGRILYDNIVNFLEGAAGFIRNAIDAVWDTLVGIGEFLWAIGEAIYDALTWLAEQIVEYGSFILGLLMIFVGLFIFFWVVQQVMRIGNNFYQLSQGNILGAAEGYMGTIRKGYRDIKSAGTFAEKQTSGRVRKIKRWMK
jgi:nitrogen fixation-related uncharacterized protein